jgi:DNA-binding transcriptional LysR family regulator
MDLLKAMDIFVRSVDAGSFTRLARSLDVTTSAVSKQVDALEAKLGVALVVRHSRGLTLTDAGLRYVGQARDLLRDIKRLNEHFRAAGEEPAGILRVTMPVTFGKLHVAPHIASFLAAYPKIDVEVQSSQHFVDIAATSHDVAVRLGELRDSSLIAAKLAPMRRLLCCSQAYIARFGAPDSPYDLFKHNCLLNTLNTRRNLWFFSNGDGVHPVTVSGSLQTDDSETLLRAALDGVGIVLLGSWLVAPHIRAKELVPIMSSWRADVTSGTPAIHAVYARTAYPAPKIRAFIDFLKARFGSPPYWERDTIDKALRPPDTIGE